MALSVATAQSAGPSEAIIVIDEYDPFRDDGMAYAGRLRQDGADVTVHFYEDMPHVFFQFVNVFERGDETVATVGRVIVSSVSATKRS